MSELIKALAEALPKIEGAGKSGLNPHFGKSYSELSDVINAMKPILEHGLWFRQANSEHEGGASVETFYIHSSGEEMSAGRCFVPANKKDAQGFGSAITYARRYGLMSAFGIAPTDDDGNAAVAAPKKEPVEYITQDQIDEIGALAQGLNVTIQSICEVGKISSLKEIQAKDFDRVIGWINQQKKAA